MEILVAENDDEIISCFNIMKQLVNSINKKDFLSQVKNKYNMWYKLVFLRMNNKIISIIGIRTYEYFGCGKFLIIDDFVTDKKERGKWYWTKMFQWVKNFAKENQCSQIQLDSNIERYQAHKFYMDMGMKISHHHFSITL